MRVVQRKICVAEARCCHCPDCTCLCDVLHILNTDGKGLLPPTPFRYESEKDNMV